MSAMRVGALLCASTLLCGSLFGQTVSSTMLGTVADPGDAAIPGIEVQVKDQLTGLVRSEALLLRVAGIHEVAAVVRRELLQCPDRGQRAGDFSKTVDQNGKAIQLLDADHAQSAGNQYFRPGVG